MPDPAPTPTEDQIKAANEDQEAQWAGDFKEEDLTVPYKPKVEEETTEDPDKDEKLEENTDEEEAVIAAPAPVITVQDPGAYEPADYSFETTLANGKTVTIKTPEEAEKLSEDPENFETPKQLLDFIKKTTQMQNKLDKDYSKWEDQKKIFEDQTKLETQRNEAVTAIEAEINYLVGKGKVPKAAKEYLDANWSDPEIAKQPGIKEQIALLNYMTKENAVRAKAGIKPFGPVDAFTAMQSDTAEQAKLEAAKKAGEARKVAGARVAGVAPSQAGTFVPKGIAVGRPGVFSRGAAVWDN